MCWGGPDPAIASTVSINENAPEVIPAPAWTTTVNPPTSIVRASPGSWTTPPPSTSPITVLRYLRVTVPPDETMLWVGSTSYCGQSARCDTRSMLAVSPRAGHVSSFGEPAGFDAGVRDFCPAGRAGTHDGQTDYWTMAVTRRRDINSCDWSHPSVAHRALSRLYQRGICMGAI